MRVAIAQLNQVVGDLSGNAARILEAAAEARRGGAQLLVTPELWFVASRPRICCCVRHFFPRAPTNCRGSPRASKASLSSSAFQSLRLTEATTPGRCLRTGM